MTQRRGYVTLLPKKGDQTLLRNKRPIVLLDIIYKIVAKVLAKRVTNVVDKLVGRDQTGFIKGRNIGENIRLIRAPLGGGAISSPPSRFLAISSKPMQVSPPNLQYPLSQHFYTLC